MDGQTSIEGFITSTEEYQATVEGLLYFGHSRSQKRLQNVSVIERAQEKKYCALLIFFNCATIVMARVQRTKKAVVAKHCGAGLRKVECALMNKRKTKQALDTNQ